MNGFLSAGVQWKDHKHLSGWRMSDISRLALVNKNPAGSGVLLLICFNNLFEDPSGCIKKLH
jgi:hypothetical protein